jgi:hypothetical protein
MIAAFGDPMQLGLQIGNLEAEMSSTNSVNTIGFIR